MPFEYKSLTHLTDVGRVPFARRKHYESDSEIIKTLRLGESDYRNTLTIDVGPKTIEIAKTASEREREWLYLFLRENYPRMMSG